MRISMISRRGSQRRGDIHGWSLFRYRDVGMIRCYRWWRMLVVLSGVYLKHRRRFREQLLLRWFSGPRRGGYRGVNDFISEILSYFTGEFDKRFMACLSLSESNVFLVSDLICKILSFIVFSLDSSFRQINPCVILRSQNLRRSSGSPFFMPAAEWICRSSKFALPQTMQMGRLTFIGVDGIGILVFVGVWMGDDRGDWGQANNFWGVGILEFFESSRIEVLFPWNDLIEGDRWSLGSLDFFFTGVVAIGERELLVDPWSCGLLARYMAFSFSIPPYFRSEYNQAPAKKLNILKDISLTLKQALMHASFAWTNPFMGLFNNPYLLMGLQESKHSTKSMV